MAPTPGQGASSERQRLQRLSDAALAEQLKPYLLAAHGRWHAAQGTGLTPEDWLLLLVQACRGELSELGDIVPLSAFALSPQAEREAAACAILAQPYCATVLADFRTRLSALPVLEYDPVNELFRGLRHDLKGPLGITGVQVMMCVRSALTGRLDGPCLVQVVCLLGKERCLERTNQSFICA